MSRFLRFFRVAIVVIACAIGVTMPRVGYADTTYPFTVTTTSLYSGTIFSFAISAAGTFYVDWGDGSAEQTISKSDTSVQEISHTYVTAGTYTIGLRGLATGYNSDDLVPAISFGYLPDGEIYARHSIASVSGSLGAIFPTLGTNVPSFVTAFANCYKLTSIPGTLFSGVTGARPHMFDSTFYNNAISVIPENLFSGISGAAESMFYGTFTECHNLMFLPNGLFSGVSGTASGLFYETFRNCNSLIGYIPKNLFNFGTGGLTYNANNGMMTSIFDGTNLATSCDSYGMERYTSDFDSYFGGKVVCQMPDVTVNFSCQMPTNVPGYPIGDGTSPSPIVAPITSGNVTFTFPSGANCNGDYGTKLNAWTCDAAICNNRTWSSNGTAVFNEPWDGSTELHFHMVYEPTVFSVPLDEDRYWYDGDWHYDTSPVAGNVTTLYEKYGFGWSTNPNGPFTTTLTLSASDLPTANGFEFGGWYSIYQYDVNNPAEFDMGNLIVDGTGHVVVLPTYVGAADPSSPRLVANWIEVDTNAQTGADLSCYDYSCTDCAFSQGFNGTSTFNQGGLDYYGANVQYGDNIVVPSKNACEREGYYYDQWILSPFDFITAGSNNTNYTWNHSSYGMLYPDWQRIETTITLNPQNGNAGGGTTALYTIAANQDDNSASGVYLDSTRTEPMTVNTNPIAAPTAPPTATLTFNLNDSVADPASLSYTPKTHYYYDGNNAVSQTCGQRYGITISNDGKTFTVPAQFNGYYSAASGGTQYVEKRNLPSGESVYFITQAGIDAGLAYSTDTTWYGQWERVNPIDACVDEFQRPSRHGYIFDGWWTAPSGGSRVTNPANLTIDSNTVLYAHWNLGTFNFVFDVNAGDVVLGTVGSIYEKYNTGWSTNENGPFNPIFTLSGNQLPTRPGYVFAGFTDAVENGNAVGTYSNGVWTAPAPAYGGDTKAFYAQWTVATYNITYNYNGGTANSSALPAGYTQLEYIESTGTQYIDTGYKPNQDTSVEITYMYTGTTSSNQIVLGTTESAAATNAVNGLVFLLFPNRVGFGNGTGTTVNLSGVGNTAGTKYTLRYDKNVVSLDGSTIATLPVTTWSAPYNLYLFGRNTANSLSLAMRGRIYSYKAWDNGTLVQHLVPAKNSSNVVGMYDLVSGVFFENARTGDFTEGNAVTTAYPATYTYGTGTTIYGVPSRANSIFESWCRGYDSTNNTYSDCVFPHEITTTDLGNKTMYAKWTCAEHYHLNGAGANESCEADVYTVTLDMNHTDTTGYTNPTPTIYEQYGIGWATTNNAQTTFGNITLTGNQLPTRTGYTLTGFYDAASGGNPVGTFSNGAWTPPSSTTYTANATLYAQWTVNTYTISYVDNGGTRSTLPAGYTQLEYLQSDGSQIIETSVMGVNTRVVIDAQWTGSSVSSIRGLAGYSNNSSNYAGTYVGVRTKNWVVANSANSAYNISSADNKTRLSVVFDRDSNADNRNRATLTANGQTVASTRSSTSSLESVSNSGLKLFVGHAGVASTPDGFTGRVYRAMIFDNDTNRLLFNGFPARRDSDDALGIYDTVRGVFIENSGDGTFTAGGDVTTPYPATYTYGTGAMVYGVPTRANSVFDGWCTDSNLTTGCASPYEITTTDSGNKTLYAKWTCDGGYAWNSQTSSCEMDPVFTVTTTDDIANGTEFKFKISARGWFGVDCGADGTLSGPSGPISGNIITRMSGVGSNTQASEYTYMCTYSSAGSKTIKFIGRAAAYTSVANVPVIGFFSGTMASNGVDIVTEGTEIYIASVSGSLGAMFPTKPGETYSQPRFYQTFQNAKNMSQTLQSISGIFDGVYGQPVTYMFTSTFRGCSSLTGSIPESLFAGISGTPTTSLFALTFRGCSGLSGSIPANLFGRVVDGEYVGINGAPASWMFRQTFSGCSSLTGSIPATLFGRMVNGVYYGINGEPASNMFRQTFSGCSGLSGEIPSNLFGPISGDAAGYMFMETFYNCSGLTGTIPGNLFGGQNLTGPGKSYMFSMTFYGCTGLSGYVPENLFGQMTVPETVPERMMYRVFVNSGLATSCPCGTTEVTTSPFRTYWQSTSSSSSPKKVSCTVGLSTGQHWYNGTCATACSNAAMDELHVGAITPYPVLNEKISTPSINIKYGNTTCYVPLDSGNGGTGTLNMTYSGNVYHPSRPDDITPTGFGQRD